MGTHALTHTMQHAFTHPYHIPPPPTHTHTHPENPHSSPQSDKPEVTDTYVYIVGQGLVSPLATDVFAPAETESYVHPFSYGYGYGSGSGPGAPSAAGKQDYVFAPPAEVCGWVGACVWACICANACVSACACARVCVCLLFIRACVCASASACVHMCMWVKSSYGHDSVVVPHTSAHTLAFTPARPSNTHKTPTSLTLTQH